MRNSVVRLSLALAAVVALAGCELLPGTSTTTTTVVQKAVPNFVGKGLQFSQDEAQKTGFKSLLSHDALGTNRKQILDRDWKVCFQSPAGGTVASTTTKLDFGVVKLEETCPATDNNNDTQTTATPPTMPNLIGKSGSQAQQLLGTNASITFKDISGNNRSVIIPGNWKICSQSPSAGEPFAGIPATLSVVKTDETCPAPPI